LLLRKRSFQQQFFSLIVLVFKNNYLHAIFLFLFLKGASFFFEKKKLRKLSSPSYSLVVFIFKKIYGLHPKKLTK